MSLKPVTPNPWCDAAVGFGGAWLPPDRPHVSSSGGLRGCLVYLWACKALLMLKGLSGFVVARLSHPITCDAHKNHPEGWRTVLGCG